LTTQEHGRLLGILHLVQGGLGVLVLLFFVPFLLFFVLAAGREDGEAAGLFLGLFGLIFSVIFLLLAVPPVVAGYGLLKGKSWARTWGIISAVVASMSFPFGTALCVYTLWFLFGEGREWPADAARPVGAARPGSLGAGQPLGWDARQAARGRQGEYAPPPQPPDWRGEG